MRQLIFLLLIISFSDVTAQRRSYKRTEYEIRYARHGRDHFSRFNKSKVHTEYRIFNDRDQLIEWVEYGLQYCIGPKRNTKQSKNPDGAIIVEVYRISDFKKINKITYFKYDSLGNVTHEECHQFYIFPRIDTVVKVYQYNSRSKIAQLTTTAKDEITSTYFSYDENGNLKNIVDQNGRLNSESNKIERFDSLGNLVELINGDLYPEAKRVEYINDYFCKTEIGYNEKDRPEYIRETYGYKDRPEKIFLRTINNPRGELTIFKYKRWLKLKKMVKYKFNFNALKKEKYIVTKYKYQYL